MSNKMLEREELYEDEDMHNHNVNISDLQTLHNEYKDLFENKIFPDNHLLLQSKFFKNFLKNDNQVKNLKKIVTNPNFSNVINKIKNEGQNTMRGGVIEFKSKRLI